MSDQDPALALIDPLEIVRGTRLHPEADREAAVRAFRELADEVYAGRYARGVLDQLKPLCPCHRGNPEEDEDGPQQECPIHGDGTTFVALCRWRDAVVAATHAVNDTVADAPGLVVVQRPAWVRLRDLLNAGPWAPVPGVAYDGPGTVPF